MKNRRHLLMSILLVTVVLSGCTAVTVNPLDRSLNIEHVCIEENPKVVMMAGFVDMLREGFSRHGIATEVYSQETPSTCENVLTYTALRSWDISVYLTYAKLTLKKNGEIIGSGEYRLKGKGGFSLLKWKGVKSKMDPVIDELLREY